MMKMTEWSRDGISDIQKDHLSSIVDKMTTDQGDRLRDLINEFGLLE